MRLKICYCDNAVKISYCSNAVKISYCDNSNNNFSLILSYGFLRSEISGCNGGESSWLSFEMLCLVVCQKLTDISWVFTASIIRARLHGTASLKTVIFMFLYFFTDYPSFKHTSRYLLTAEPAVLLK
jgi:hypothetical protein